MVVYTIRNRIMNNRVYGYETSQVYRHRILDSEGIDNKFLICTPFMHIYWWKRLESMGFRSNNVVVIPHTFSDLSDRVHTVSESAFEETLDDKSYEIIASHQNGKTYKFAKYFLDTMVNSSGHVTNYTKRSLSLEVIETGILTDGLFYITDNFGNFQYLNRDGSTAILGSKFDGEFCYQLSEEDDDWISTEELTIMYLKDKSQADDIFINDSMQHQWLELSEWAKSNDMSYYSVLHYDHFNAKTRLERYTTELPNDKFMVASKYIIPSLLESESTGSAFQPIFVHPVGRTIKPTPDTVGLSSNKFMLAGNLTDLKRVDMAVSAFKILLETGVDVSLDIYGFTKREFLKTYPEFDTGFLDSEPYASKLVFKGMIDSDRIPRSDYLGYVSCSATEMYANALVECLAEGLIPVLSNTEFTHTPILQELGLLTAFDDVEGLISSIRYVLSLTHKERLAMSESILQYAENNFSHDEARKSLLTFLELSNGEEIEEVVNEVVEANEQVDTVEDVTKSPNEAYEANEQVYPVEDVTESPNEAHEIIEQVYTVEERGTIIVNYIDEKGNLIKAAKTLISNELVGVKVTDNGVETRETTGITYDAESLKDSTINVNGRVYEFANVKDDSADITGTLVAGTTIITYVYRQVPREIKV